MSQDYTRIVSVRGSIPVADDIIFCDDVEGQLNWSGSGTGTDWVVDKYGAVNAVMRGSYGVRMQTKATTPAVGDIVTAVRNVFLTPHRQALLSACFRLPTVSTIEYFEVRAIYWDGTYQYELSLRYDRAAGIWKQYISGTYQYNIAGSSQVFHPDAWNRIEVAVDFANYNRNLRGLVCNQVNLPDINYNVLAAYDSAAPHLTVSFALKSSAASQQTMYLDDIVVLARIPQVRIQGPAVII